MRGDSLGALERTAIEQVGGDAGGPKGVAIGLTESDGGDAPLDHPEHIHPAHPVRAESACARHRAPQGRPFLGGDPGGGEKDVERGLRLVVDRHGVVLAAFFLEPQPPALALLVVVLDAQVDALVLASQQPDASLSGRVHETFKQYHAGVPVYGGGISRQLANNGLTVSIFGTIHQGIDLLEQRAGAGRATDDPPTLVILPTPFDTYVLVYRSTMRDFRTYFVDAHSGAIVHVENEVDEQGAVGSGFGIQNDLKKVSVSPDVGPPSA